MIKIFYSGTYITKHKYINKNNVCKKLKNDLRSKIVGNVEDTIYSSSGVALKQNKNVIYVGGFYYEKEHPNKSTCESVVYEELKQIDKSDLVIVNLTKFNAISSITELMYAVSKSKKIVIFCDKRITKYQIEGEYWFPIIAAKQLDNNVEIIFIEDEKQIVEYINKL